jgi:hypothetical protein
MECRVCRIGGKIIGWIIALACEKGCIESKLILLQLRLESEVRLMIIRGCAESLAQVEIAAR